MSEHEIIKQVQMAQKSAEAADAFVRQYMPFIKSETAKFLKRPPQEGQDEELGIAMFAFYESAMAYHRGRGAFLNLAALAIRNRLIDHYRKEQRHGNVISLEMPAGDEDGASLMDQIQDDRNETEDSVTRSAAQKEIAEFARQLMKFDISITDVADYCPKQERTLTACMRVLEYAKEHPELLDILVESRKLPVAQLIQGSGVDRKTLERHRKYVVAILLAYTNGYEIIRGHLRQMQSGRTVLQKKPERQERWKGGRTA